MRGIMYILFNCMISGLDCCFFVIVVEVSFFFMAFTNSCCDWSEVVLQVFDLLDVKPHEFLQYGLGCLEMLAGLGDSCAKETRERIRIMVCSTFWSWGHWNKHFTSHDKLHDINARMLGFLVLILFIL